MKSLTATQIVKRFTDLRNLNEPLLLSDLALFVWDQFEECPTRAVLRNSWELIRLLAANQGVSSPFGRLDSPSPGNCSH